MLVLSAKDKENIYLDGGRIVLTVVQTLDGRVKLGFDAERSIPIDREVVHHRKQGDRNRPDNRAA